MDSCKHPHMRVWPQRLASLVAWLAASLTEIVESNGNLLLNSTQQLTANRSLWVRAIRNLILALDSCVRVRFQCEKCMYYFWTGAAPSGT